MLEEAIKSIVTETVKQTLQELGALQQTNHSVPETMTVKQLVEYIGMSESWVYQNTKNIPHEKRGRKTLFIKSEIDEWREQQRESKENRIQNIEHVNSISSGKSRKGYYKVV